MRVSTLSLEIKSTMTTTATTKSDATAGSTTRAARGGARNREKTKEGLEAAILRIKNKGLKLSIKAVAEEAGVDPSLVHNTYPDIAEEIRAMVGKASRKQRDAKHQELLDARKLNRELQAQVTTLTSDLNELASVNLTLLERVQTLEAEVAGKVAQITRPR